MKILKWAGAALYILTEIMAAKVFGWKGLVFVMAGAFAAVTYSIMDAQLDAKRAESEAENG